MSYFVKYFGWFVLIMSWPIAVWMSVYVGAVWGILSFFIILYVSGLLSDRQDALCGGVEDTDTLNEKLAAGADLNAKGQFCKRPLIETIKRSNDVNLIKAMIQKGANVNIVGDRETPLSVALEKGKYDIAKLLISSGADLKKLPLETIKLDDEYYETLLDAGYLITDDNIKEIIEFHNILLNSCKQHTERQMLQTYMYSFAKIFKLFVKYNVDLSNFWKYTVTTYIYDKAFNYPDIRESLGKKNRTTQENIKLIDMFLDKILEETQNIYE